MKSESALGQAIMIQKVFTEEYFKENPEIRRTRNKLLLILSIQLVLSIIYDILGIFIFVEYNANDKNSSMNEVLFVSLTLFVIPILFYIASIIDVYRYDRRGIRIIAWVFMVLLMIYLAFKIAGFIERAENSFSTGDSVFGEADIVMDTGIFCIRVLLAVLTIVYAFDLAAFMKKPKANQII